MIKFLQKLIHRFSVRTLRVDILTLFLSLTVIAFALVITYSYVRNYSGILEYSKKTMQRVSATVIERMRNISLEVESTLNDSSGALLYSKGVITIHDPDLIRFLLNVNAVNAEISSMALVLPSKDSIKVSDVALSTQSHYITDPAKPLPLGSRFVIRQIEESQSSPSEIWTYVDKDYNSLGSEKLPQATVDLSTRRWYLGAVSTRNIYWDPIPYYLSGTHELGISMGKAVFDRQDHLLGVVGVDLSFISLSKFISSQRISRSGEVLIVDQQGKVVLPIGEYLGKPVVTAKLAAAAWKKFTTKHVNDFIFQYDSNKYLAYVSQLPESFGQNWSVLVIAPFLDFFANLVRIQIEIVLITLAILLVSIIIISFFSKKISQPIVNLSKEIDHITNLDLSSTKRIHSHIVEINLIDSSIATMRSTVRSFSRYVPKEIVRQLLHRHKDINLKVEKKDLTILFSDIQDFTTMAETYPLDKLMTILSAYFDGLSKIILRKKGTIDKYIGDSIMAFWGAPLEDATHTFDACMTVLLCSAYLKTFNERNHDNSYPVFHTRFGINTGEVLVGNVGTSERMNYTVIGDPVNLAARLQSVGKVYHVEIIISEAVYQKIKSQFLCRPLDKIAVKGKHEETEIYELVAVLAPGTELSAKSAQIKLCQSFAKAYQIFRTGDFATAKSLFQAIQKEFPNDYPTQMFLQRLH